MERAEMEKKKKKHASNVKGEKTLEERRTKALERMAESANILVILALLLLVKYLRWKHR